jgi:hypothetical protein
MSRGRLSKARASIMSTAQPAIRPSLQGNGTDQRVFPFPSLWQPVQNRRERVLFVLGFAVLTAIRFPNAFRHGRFWAEEGSLFYANAWSLPWWQALAFSHSGYLNLVANFAGLLAYLVPVAAAPHVSSGVALIVHCCPAILVAFAPDAWLQKRAVLLAALLLIATPPGTEEVWLNAINSQFILTLCAGVILGLETRNGALGVFQKSLLWLASLTGPGSWCLVPLFFLRAAIDRSWPRAVQGAILLSGALIQLAFFFDLSQREVGLSALLLNAVVLVKHVLLPLLGIDQTVVLANQVALFVTGAESKSLLLLVIPLFLAIGCITTIKPRQPPL